MQEGDLNQQNEGSQKKVEDAQKNTLTGAAWRVLLESSGWMRTPAMSHYVQSSIDIEQMDGASWGGGGLAREGMPPGMLLPMCQVTSQSDPIQLQSTACPSEKSGLVPCTHCVRSLSEWPNMGRQGWLTPQRRDRPALQSALGGSILPERPGSPE